MQRFLVLANCRLGDSLVMVSALKLLRSHFSPCHIALASEVGGNGIVSAEEILGGRGLVDEFIGMASPPGRFARLVERLRFFCRMRRKDWDAGIVLMPPYPPLTERFVKRMRLYLRGCGVKRIVAPLKIEEGERDGQGALLRKPQVAETLNEIVGQLGVPVPPPGESDVSLPPLASLVACGDLEDGMQYIAVAPGANMQSKRWPMERYAAVVASLVSRWKVVPLYIGGENERGLCEELQKQCAGVCLIGRPLGEVESAMRRCSLYVGNDTGLAHLAAAVGLPCVVVHSCRDIPGIWEPYASKLNVLRAGGVSCEGCLLTDCTVSGHPCLMSIAPDAVVKACGTFLA